MMIIGVFALVVGLSLYALLDAARTPAEGTRTLPKWLWVITIVLFPVVGPLFWLFFGRPPRTRTAPGAPVSRWRVPSIGRKDAPPPAAQAPDDDEEYLRWLSARADRLKRDRQRKAGGATGKDAGQADDRSQPGSRSGDGNDPGQPDNKPEDPEDAPDA